MSLDGRVINGVIVLDEHEKLPEGTRVEVTVKDEGPPVPERTQATTAKELLMQFAGCMTDLPSDLARNHDHYLHGTPRK